jgi:hypothetical protein
MSYSQFETLEQSIDAFSLTIVEASFFPDDLQPIVPSDMLVTFLHRSIPIVSAASEKARSEGIIYPILLEVRELLHDQVTLFSGREFSFDSTIGLSGIVDFLLCRSTSVLVPQAPAIMLVEAKKADIASGYGQCVAEMVAAQRFNRVKQVEGDVYGCISNGLLWRFLRLTDDVVTIDLTDYSLQPVGALLAQLVWMVG